MSATLKAVNASGWVFVEEFLKVEPGFDDEDVVDNFLPLFCVYDLFLGRKKLFVSRETTKMCS